MGHSKLSRSRRELGQLQGKLTAIQPSTAYDMPNKLKCYSTRQNLVRATNMPLMAATIVPVL